MAEGGVSQDGSEEAAKETQECSICFSEFKEPRMLDCKHRFCLKCLQELAQAAQSTDDKKLACPLCRKETILPEGGVDKLVCSREVATEEEDQDESQGPKVICQACDEENEAISRCMDCEQYLCKECQKAHQRWVAFKTHKISTLEELGPDGKLKDYVPKCKEHPEEELSYYCNTCDALICNKCIISKHKKSSHFFDSIETAFLKCSQELNEAVSQTTKCIQECDLVDIDHSRHRLATMLRRTKIQISLAVEEMFSEIKQREQHLRQQAQDVFTKRDKKFVFAATANKTVSKVKNILSRDSNYEVLESKTKLLQDLREHQKLRQDSYPDTALSHKQSFLSLGKSGSGTNVGSLHMQERWNITWKHSVPDEKPMPEGWTCLSAYSTGTLVLSGNDEFLLYPNKMHKKGTGYRPTALTVNSEDQPVILDGLSIRVLNQEFELLHQFVPGTIAGIKCKPTCLAVDENDLIAVGYKDSGQISLHKSDGTLITTMPAPKIEDRLVASNRRLIYTMENESDNCKIVATDFAGKRLFTMNTNLSNGVHCCDEAGDIYFVTEGNLLHCSADGVIVESWKWNEKPLTPKDLTYFPGSRMYALEEKLVREFYIH